ncbi:Bacterial Ig-like domain (group 2) [compost metagenome]
MSRSLLKFATIFLAFHLVVVNLAETGYAAPETESPAIEWAELYGSNSSSSLGRSVTATSDGGYVAVGAISGYSVMQSAYIVKVNDLGEKQWEQQITSSGVYGSEDSNAYNVLETSDGGFLVSGAATDTSGRPRSVIQLIKLDATGNVQWNKAYPDLSYNHLYGQAVVETANGDFIVTGYNANSYAEAPAFLLKVNSSGHELWFRTFWLEDNQYFNDLIATPDGGIIAIGAIDSMFDVTLSGAIIVKVNDEGQEQWQKIQRTDNDRKTALAIDAAHDGGYVITGLLDKSNGSISYLQKINETGDVIWEKTVDTGAGHSVFEQVQSFGNGYALIGRNSEGTYPSITTKYQILITDETGELEKAYLFGDSGLYSVGKGIVTDDQGFLVIGEVKKDSNYRMQLVKLAGTNVPSDPELINIEFSPSHYELTTGQTVSSVVNAVYSNASVTDVTYSAQYESLDPNVAIVDSTGQITGIGPGTTFIIASYGGLQASASVQVIDDSPGETGTFFLDSDEYSLSIGTELDVSSFFRDELGYTFLVTQDTAFSSDNPEIAAIDGEGSIRGISPGITYITAVYNGLTYRASVWVVRPYTPPAAN